MTNALYGEHGFYRRPAGPAAHFRTSVHASPLFAAALARLALEVWALVDHQPGFTVVDVGAGRGELLAQLCTILPEQVRLTGVEMVGRPAGLPSRIAWYHGLSALEPVPYGLLVANEWLDNVPVDVVEGGRLVEVDVEGGERALADPDPRDASWCRRWAPDTPRVEVGRSRDEAWAGAAGRIGCGLAVAIDYRLDLDRHRYGTLTGFRGGHQVRPVPDGSCDLTAHVLLESCAVAAGGTSLLLDQASALAALGVCAARPPRQQARTDPAGYLRALSSAGQAAELVDPYGLGGFGWLLQPREVGLPATFGTSLDRQSRYVDGPLR